MKKTNKPDGKKRKLELETIRVLGEQELLLAGGAGRDPTTISAVSTG